MRGRGSGASARIYDVRSSDPAGELIDRSGVDDAALEQIAELMSALAELRAAEKRLAEASQRYMRLGENDMRAIHFLIVAGHEGEDVTPGALAQHLGISTASTTKLLDRLERGGHIVRRPHPDDRRALVVDITPATRATAMQSVGRQQARRFAVAARLSPEERGVVTRFLRDTAAMIDPEAADAAL